MRHDIIAIFMAVLGATIATFFIPSSLFISPSPGAAGIVSRLVPLDVILSTRMADNSVAALLSKEKEDAKKDRERKRGGWDRVADHDSVHRTLAQVRESSAHQSSAQQSLAHQIQHLRQVVTALSIPKINQTLVTGTGDDEFYCLAAAVYFEARGEPLVGQMAVAQVVLNRAQSHRFPKETCAVVKQRKQFSFVRGGHIPHPDMASRAWRRARVIAYLARHDDWQNATDIATNQALFFHADYVAPSWGQARPRLGQIGAHIFYR